MLPRPNRHSRRYPLCPPFLSYSDFPRVSLLCRACPRRDPLSGSLSLARTHIHNRIDLHCIHRRVRRQLCLTDSSAAQRYLIMTHARACARFPPSSPVATAATNETRSTYVTYSLRDSHSSKTLVVIPLLFAERIYLTALAVAASSSSTLSGNIINFYWPRNYLILSASSSLAFIPLVNFFNFQFGSFQQFQHIAMKLVPLYV